MAWKVVVYLVSNHKESSSPAELMTLVSQRDLARTHSLQVLLKQVHLHESFQ